jgi:hypothetical protein
MSAMPGRVTRTVAFKNLDKQLLDPGELKKYFESYAQSPRIEGLLEEAVKDGVITEETRQHVRSHWLQAYWPSVKHANRIIQRGLYWATRIARYEDFDEEKPSKERGKPLPLCTIWVCTGEYGEKRFEVINVVSDYQVTVVLLTPPPEKDLVLPSGPNHQPIWGTRSEEYPEVPGETLADTWYNTVTVRPLDLRPPE